MQDPNPIVRRAVVVALTYRGIRYIPDTKVDLENIVDLLKNTLGFQQSEITIITDDVNSNWNIWGSMRSAINTSLGAVNQSSNGRFFFYFAGHGTTVEGVEAICCGGNKDVTTTTLEELINQYNWNPTQHSLTWVFDSCFSGSSDHHSRDVEDEGKVRYLEPLDGSNTRSLFGPPQRMLGNLDAITVTYAACAKNETARGSEDGGRFTQAFAKAVKSNPNLSNRDMLVQIERKYPYHLFQHPQLIASDDWKDTQFMTPQATRSIRTLESPHRDPYYRDTRSTRTSRVLEPTRSGLRDTNLQCSIISGRVFLSGCVEATTTSRASTVEIGYLNPQYHPSVDRVLVVALGNGDVSAVKITRDGRIIQVGAASDPLVYLDGVSFAL